MALTKLQKIEQDWLYKLGFKKCSNCGVIKNTNYFCSDKNRRLCLYHSCKYCMSLSVNKDNVRIYNKKYCILDKDSIRKKRSLYRKINKGKINKKLFENALYNTYKHQVLITDEPTLGNCGKLKVICKNCSNLFYPTNQEVVHRVQAIKGKYLGERNFYCSDNCKHTCKVFNFKSNNIDPDSKLYKSKTEQQKARVCQTTHLKQLQIDEVGYNYCERCGKEVGIVELHHTLEVAKFGLESINSAGHLLVCNTCHKKFTKQCKHTEN